MVTETFYLGFSCQTGLAVTSLLSPETISCNATYANSNVSVNKFLNFLNQTTAIFPLKILNAVSAGKRLVFLV